MVHLPKSRKDPCLGDILATVTSATLLSKLYVNRHYKSDS